MYAKLGSISHGTLRPTDLVEAFKDKLSELDTDMDYSHIVSDAELHLGNFDSNPGDEDHVADLYNSLEQLTDILQEFAPPFCYFGTLEGDGSDFGFWLDPNWQQRAVEEDCLIVEDLSEVDTQNIAIGEVFFVVNDHGNLTCYQVTAAFQEVFSVV